MNHIEKLKQALEALEFARPMCELRGDSFPQGNSWHEAAEKMENAIITLRTAIEQAEKQEPVAWLRKPFGEDVQYCEKPFTTDWTPLYTTPPAAHVQKPVAWFENLKQLASICPELNIANYSEEDVDDLNCWAIEVATCIDGITTPPAAFVQDGMVLVPKRMTKAMRYVTDQEDWTWEDLLAAAEAITEDEYHEIAAALVQEPVIDKSAAIRIATALGWTPPAAHVQEQTTTGKVEIWPRAWLRESAAQRQSALSAWVGLTDEDQEAIYAEAEVLMRKDSNLSWRNAICLCADAKLREKNGGAA